MAYLNALFASNAWNIAGVDLFPALPGLESHESGTGELIAAGDLPITLGSQTYHLLSPEISPLQFFSMVFDGTGSAFLRGEDLTFDISGVILGGVIRSLSFNAAGESFGFEFLGIDLQVPDFTAAASSPGRADDQALLQALLGGDDFALMSTSDDRFQGFGGKDFAVGGQGNDRLQGGTKDDMLFGDEGRDVVIGDEGDDVLFGNDDVDRLTGTAGDDLMMGGAGRDTLKGGTGSDLFLFERGDGTDTVTDFKLNADRIVIGAGARHFSDLDLTLEGRDTRVEFADVDIVLKRVDADNLTAAHFRFGTDAAIDTAVGAFLDGWEFIR